MSIMKRCARKFCVRVGCASIVDFLFVCKTHLLFLLFDVLIGVTVVVAKAPHILVGGSYGAVVAS